MNAADGGEADELADELRANLLTPEQVVARYRGAVTIDTLERWRHFKTGPAYRRIGRLVFYHTADLFSWEKANGIAGSEATPTLDPAVAAAAELVVSLVVV